MPSSASPPGEFFADDCKESDIHRGDAENGGGSDGGPSNTAKRVCPWSAIVNSARIDWYSHGA
jgi:hypothetical protein